MCFLSSVDDIEWARPPELCIDLLCALCKVCFIRWGLSLSRSPNWGWCFFFQHIRLQPLGCFDQWINGSRALVTIHLEWASAGSSPCLPLALLSPGLPSLPPWAPLTAGCHNRQQTDKKSLGFADTPVTHTHKSPQHTQISLWLDAEAMHQNGLSHFSSAA